MESGSFASAFTRESPSMASSYLWFTNVIRKSAGRMVARETRSSEHYRKAFVKIENIEKDGSEDANCSVLLVKTW